MTAVDEHVPAIVELVEDPAPVPDQPCEICAEAKPFGCLYRGRRADGDWLGVCEACARWVVPDAARAGKVGAAGEGGT